MGLFAHWVCAKEAADALRDAGFAEVVETEAAGWQMGYPERRAQLPEWEEFDDAVARLAADAGGAALGSWIYDSDVGYLIAAEGDRGITRLVVNPDAADAYDLPLPEAWPDGAIAGFAEWSKGAPELSHPPMRKPAAPFRALPTATSSSAQWFIQLGCRTLNAQAGSYAN